jgi:curved DNA-binding protein CbpA
MNHAAIYQHFGSNSPRICHNGGYLGIHIHFFGTAVEKDVHVPRNSMTKTYYEILGVDPNADSKTIRQAYLRASLRHHPDKNPDNVEESKALFIEVGQAYENLSDPALRAKYDREIRSGARPTNTGQRASGTEQRASGAEERGVRFLQTFDAHWLCRSRFENHMG